ncbi:accessory protein NosL [Leptospira perolatii]|uniref:Accessory protein NosL n=1 Tax=Leptospira perolatii TaxID=2023191 RepID=A0A2M9ZKF6_9LEPT|nr:nitrous oxide reductase accessory protein NosL [Leptospira perolatii]PJZ68138.1 accessory protein NosL [Leptospira perolatii]PJZ72556.1 accessory protein NosL [Leptospira perolatii]
MRLCKLMLIFSLIVLQQMGCTKNEPVTPELGHEKCAHCVMAITDPKFHAQILTQKGRRVYFDSLECLRSYLKENQISLHLGWVALFDIPGKMVSVQEATYVQSEEIRSPMGGGLAAFSDLQNARSFLEKHKGKIIENILE